MSHNHSNFRSSIVNNNNIAINQENQEKIEYATDETSGDWVIAQYDQNRAAENAGEPTTNAWCEILDTNHMLKANRGYIVGYFGEEKTSYCQVIVGTFFHTDFFKTLSK